MTDKEFMGQTADADGVVCCVNRDRGGVTLSYGSGKAAYVFTADQADEVAWLLGKGAAAAREASRD